METVEHLIETGLGEMHGNSEGNEAPLLAYPKAACHMALERQHRRHGLTPIALDDEDEIAIVEAPGSRML
jgi:hypothetical protein